MVLHRKLLLFLWQSARQTVLHQLLLLFLWQLAGRIVLHQIILLFCLQLLHNFITHCILRWIFYVTCNYTHAFHVTTHIYAFQVTQTRTHAFHATLLYTYAPQIACHKWGSKRMLQYILLLDSIQGIWTCHPGHLFQYCMFLPVAVIFLNLHSDFDSVIHYIQTQVQKESNICLHWVQVSFTSTVHKMVIASSLHE
jgi:hypothetical protein